MGKIHYGIKKAGYATIDMTDPNAPVFSTPIALPGAINASGTVEESTNKIYADDVVHCITRGAKVRELEVTFIQLTRQYVVDCLGAYENANGMQTDTGTPKRHCFFFVTTDYDCGTGVETPSLHYFYDCLGQRPGIDTKTKEEEVEANEIVFSYECVDSVVAKDDLGRPVQYGIIVRDETNATMFDNFMNEIILPTTEI